jgi:hypothetical protein
MACIVFPELVLIVNRNESANLAAVIATGYQQRQYHDLHQYNQHELQSELQASLTSKSSLSTSQHHHHYQH